MNKFTLLFVLPPGTKYKEIAVAIFYHLGVCAYDVTERNGQLFMVVQYQTLNDPTELGIDVNNVGLPEGGEWFYFHGFIETGEAVLRFLDPNHIPV